MRISDWSSDVCSSDLLRLLLPGDDAPPERYLRLLGEGSVASEVTLSARRLDLRVDTITPSTGSNHGPVTVLVRGGGFTGVSAVTLVGVGIERTATSVAVVDGTRLHATFDLNGLEPGLYDLKVEPAAGSAAATGAFHVSDEASAGRVEEHTSELQSLMRMSYAVC